ncbi:MAG: CsgG/HfaB family protein [Vicinamibacterales bacterium]
MTTTFRILSRAIPALMLIALPFIASAQTGSVQVTASDTRVFLSADVTSAVVTPVPVGAVLQVVSQTGDWYEVRLPKDASGFDRVGFVQRGKVKVVAEAAGSGGTPRATSVPAPQARAVRPRAAVLSFEFGTIQQWWSGNWDIGKGISDMLVDELLQTGQISLLERKQIDAVLGEQNLANSNRADVSAKQAASLGKVLGANMLITGSVTKFGSEEKNVGGAAGSVAGRFMGGAGAKNTTANVALTIRVIDASTSEILASVKAEGKSNRKGLLLGTAIGGNFGAINMGSKDFRETILGEATEKAVKEAAAKLAPAMMNAAR